MRKTLMIVVAAIAFAVPAFATYYVVLKDGTKYPAKSKPAIVNGKAMIQLETGSTIAVDPALIDYAKSEEATKFGGGRVLAQEEEQRATRSQSSLGTAIKLRKLQQQQAAAGTETAPPPPPAGGATGSLGNEVMDKFARAYENVGIFEQKVTSPSAHALRVELTADSEEKVFNAISATSFLIVRNAGLQGVQIDMVELFMKTTTGGSAGRFQMLRADAIALDGKQMTREDYFVKKVLY